MTRIAAVKLSILDTVVSGGNNQVHPLATSSGGNELKSKRRVVGLGLVVGWLVFYSMSRLASALEVTPDRYEMGVEAPRSPKGATGRSPPICDEGSVRLAAEK